MFRPPDRSTRPRHPRRLLLGPVALTAAAALVACAGTAPAQSAQLRAGAWWLVGKDVFNGAGLSASLPLPRNFLVEAHWQRGAGQPLAVLCAFPPPGTYCPYEPVNLNAEMVAAAVAYRLPWRLRAPWSAGARVAAGIGSVTVDGAGVLTGRAGRFDAGTFPLFVLGADAGRQLGPRLPLRIVADAEAGFAVRQREKCLDCGADPTLSNGFRIVTLQLGLAWPLGAARH